MAKKKNTSSKTKKSRMGIDPFAGVGIIQEIEKEAKSSSTAIQNIEGKEIATIPLKYISPDPNQPRKNIDPKSQGIKDLAESIKKHGFINFITVRKESARKYIIVAGERRYTAAKEAGLERIPVVVSFDKEPVDYALVQMEENLQREDLTPFDELEGYNRLITEFGLKQKDIVELVNKKKSYISKMMSLNKLSTKVKSDISEWDLDVSRDILWDIAKIPHTDQEFIWKKIRSKPVRSALEKATLQLEASKAKEGTKRNSDDLEPQALWEALKKAVSKDKSILLKYIPHKKATTLLKDFGK